MLCVYLCVLVIILSTAPGSLRAKIPWLVAALFTLSWHRPRPDPLRVIHKVSPVVQQPQGHYIAGSGVLLTAGHYKHVSHVLSQHSAHTAVRP